MRRTPHRAGIDMPPRTSRRRPRRTAPRASRVRRRRSGGSATTATSLRPTWRCEELDNAFDRIIERRAHIEERNAQLLARRGVLPADLEAAPNRPGIGVRRLI